MSDEREIVQKLRDDAAGMISAATEQRQYYAVLGVYAMTCLEAADEIARLRSELAESARNVISQMAVEDELRSLITEWADEQVPFRLLTTAEANLRKAVGR